VDGGALPNARTELNSVQWGVEVSVA